MTIDDDPYFYEDGDRKHLQRDGNGKEGALVGKALQFVTKQPAKSFSGLGASGTERLNRVRNAAYLSLAAIGPTRLQVGHYVPGASKLTGSENGDSLASEFDDEPWWRVITGFGVYARLATGVTFPIGPGKAELRDAVDAFFEDGDMVTVRVSYLFPCNVPVARRFVCQSLLQMTGLPQALTKVVEAFKSPSLKSLSDAEAALTDELLDALSSFRRAMVELSAAEWSILQLPFLAMPDEYFIVLRGEATLPNHGAAYKYYSEFKQSEEES